MKGWLVQCNHQPEDSMHAQGDSAMNPGSVEPVRSQLAEDCPVERRLTGDALKDRTALSESRAHESFLQRFLPVLMGTLSAGPHV